MKIDYLIVGQGIAGTLLSYELLKAGKKVMVLDGPPDKHKASLVAGAIINPMAGKHWSPSQEQERLLPVALETYRQLEQQLAIPLIQKVPMYIFHKDAAERNLFLKKEDQGLLQVCDEGILEPFFFIPEGLGCIKKVWMVNAEALLAEWRLFLSHSGCFLESVFDLQKLELLESGIRYGMIDAQKVLFCEGAIARENPFFNTLPFTRNRGEALILSIPGLPANGVYNGDDIRLIPRKDGLFWCGSNYQWKFNNLEPSLEWRDEVEQKLKRWLRIPFRATDHIVAERPTTAGQFPFIGMHPEFPGIGIFNGLGTRGFSAAPFWSKSLTHYLCRGSSSIADYPMERFVAFFKKR